MRLLFLLLIFPLVTLAFLNFGNHFALAASSLSCDKAHSFEGQLNESREYFLNIKNELPLVSLLLKQQSLAASNQIFNQKSYELAQLINRLFDQIVIGKDELKKKLSFEGKSPTESGRLVSRTYGALEVELSEILDLSDKDLQRILFRRHVRIFATSSQHPIGFLWPMGPDAKPSASLAPDMTATRPPFETAYGRAILPSPDPASEIQASEEPASKTRVRIGFPISEEKDVDDPVRVRLAIDIDGEFVLFNSQFRHPGHIAPEP